MRGFPIERLGTFLADLRNSGFSVGLVERERVWDLLLELEVAHRMPDNSQTLSNMLGAILCCNGEQQIQFARLFASHFGSWSVGPALDDAKPEAVAEIEEGEPPADRPPIVAVEPAARHGASRRQIVFRAVLVAGLTAVGLPLWMHPSGPIVAPPAPSFSPANPAPSVLSMWPVLVVYPVFAVIGLWIAAPGRPFSAYLTQRRVDFRPQMVRLMVAPEDFNPFVDGELQRRAQILRRPTLVESQELDVERSLSATLEQGGLFTAVLARRAIAPEYLVLIERRSPNDHVAKLAETLVAAWRQAQVFVDVYYFNGDLRRLSPSPAVPASTFEEVASRYPDHSLTIIGSGEQFFDVVSGALQPWAMLLQSYARRTLLTPDPPALWGYRETLLRAELNLAVLPLEPASVPALIEILTAEDTSRLHEPVFNAEMSARRVAPLAELLEDRPIRWVEAGTPDERALASLEADLREALPPAAHDWLVACAVYPELNWKITLHLGRKLTGSEHSWDARHLARLCWLPWFRIGRMPPWLRRRLTDAMPGELYRRIRQTLSMLLLSGVNETARGPVLSMGLDDRSRTAVIERSVANQVRDSVLIDFLTRLRIDRTAVKLPGALARRVAGTGWFRSLLSDAPLNDLSASATIVHELLQTAGLHLVEAASVGQDGAPRSADSPATSFGAGLRRVVSFRQASGNVITVPDAHYLYLPPGNKPVRLIDAVTAALLRARRGLLGKLAIWHVALTVLVGTVFYWGVLDTANPVVGMMAAGLWTLGPFALLYTLLVRPVVVRLARFPEFSPADPGPRHLCRRFFWSASPHAALFAGLQDERLARTAHEKLAPGPAGVTDWSKVSADAKQSASEFVKRSIENLKYCGFLVVPSSRRVRPIAFTEAELDELAQREHLDSIEERRRNGWTHGPQRDNEKRTHPDLLGWLEITEERREASRTMIRKLPEIFASAALEIQRKY